LDLLEAGELGEDYVRAEKTVSQANEHIKDLLHSTPAAQALEDILDLVTGGDPHWFCNRLVVATDTKPSLILCQEKIEELFGEDSNIDPMLSSELPEAELSEDTGLIYLLTSQENIRHLFMLRYTPKWCRIVICRGKAGRVFDSLEAILAMQELHAYHPIAHRIKEQIEKNEPALPAAATLRYDDPLMTEGDLVPKGTSQCTARDAVVVELSEHPPQQYAPGSIVYVYDRDSSWGYTEKAARDLQEDDFLLIPSDWMYAIIKRSMHRIDDVLRKQNEKHVQSFQAMVRLYYQNKIINGNMSKIEIVEKINREQSPSKPITKENLDYWLQGAHTSSENDERPHAPRDHEQFIAFAKELGFPEDYSQKDLYTGVRQARVGRQLEGRRLKREVLSYLSDHLDHISYGNLPPEVVGNLRREAARNSYKVQRVFKPLKAEC
jgi:hypothetical protein